MALFGSDGPRAVTVGAALLADVLEAPLVRVDWRPPLEHLEPDPAVDAANQQAVGRMLAVRPQLVCAARWTALSGWRVATRPTTSPAISTTPSVRWRA